MVTDAPAVEEVAEQATEDSPHVEDVAPDEPEAAPEADITDGGEVVDPDAVPEADPDAEPELPEPDAAVHHFTQAELDERDEARERAGGQRRETELRKSMGDEATVEARMKAYQAKLVADPSDDGTEIRQIIQDNTLNVTDVVMRRVAQQAAGAYGYSDAQVAGMTATIDQLSGTDLSAYASELFTGAVVVAVEAARTEELEGREAEVSRRLAEEMAAKNIESAPRRESAPKTPAGSASAANSYTDPTWVRQQMNKDPNWLQQMSPDGKTTNLVRSRPAIEAARGLATKRNE